MVRVARRAATKTDCAPVMPSRTAVLRPKDSSVPDAGGQPLDCATRAVMESKFGCDFSQVRVHSDAAAAASAQRLGARAYAIADRLVFDRGEYRPESAEGRELLGHELAHVAQWRAGGSRPVAGPVRLAPAGAPSEREADASATRGGPVSPMLYPAVHRKLSKKESVSLQGKPLGEYEIEMDTSANGPRYDHVEISFTPDQKSPQADEIQFIQIAKSAVSPQDWTRLHPEQADLERYTTQEDPNKRIKGGYHVDIDPVGKKPREPGTQMPYVSPDYPHLKRTFTPSPPITQPGGLTTSGGGVWSPQSGYHRGSDIRAAIMTDDPGGGPIPGQYGFETVAYNKNHGFGYGTVYWGFDYDPTPPQGKPNITNEKADVKTELSPTFDDALRRFQKFYKS